LVDPVNLSVRHASSSRIHDAHHDFRHRAATRPRRQALTRRVRLNDGSRATRGSVVTNAAVPSPTDSRIALASGSPIPAGAEACDRDNRKAAIAARATAAKAMVDHFIGVRPQS
jgi:hypothetical protein